MKAKLKCWDEENEQWIFADSDSIETEFTYNNGKWRVRYTEEKNMVRDGIEIDAPVWQEVENPQLFVHFLHDTQPGFYLSIPINNK